MGGLRSLSQTQTAVLVVLVAGWAAAVVSSTESNLANPTFGLFGAIAFAGMISAFFAVAVIGVLRRWRWMFALLTLVFLLNFLSVVGGAIGLWFAPLYVGASDPSLTDFATLFINAFAFCVGVAMFIRRRTGRSW
jgi:hypothetical protein